MSWEVKEFCQAATNINPILSDTAFSGFHIQLLAFNVYWSCPFLPLNHEHLLH